jgi:hypothetical protein
MKWKNTFLVGVYRCEMTYSKNQGFQAKWSPDLPSRQLSDQEWAQYRSGRDNLIAEVGKAIGGSVLVVEVE